MASFVVRMFSSLTKLTAVSSFMMATTIKRDLLSPQLSKSFLCYPSALATTSTPSSASSNNNSASPVIVVNVAHLSQLTTSYLQKLIAHFIKVDDVFDKVFLTQTIVVNTSDHRDSPAITSLQVKTPVGEWQIDEVIYLSSNSPGKSVPDGPYFLLGSTLHQAWRLYADHLGAFVSTVIPTEDDVTKFRILDSISSDGFHHAVAVPSRLYDIKSADKPLSGLRITIKDNYRLAGLKTSLMNKSFLDTYDEDTETATILRKLISLGAVIVGKTKLCAFASSEEATDQWIDFHAPFNPRGDGYQTPSGSTTGGAASLAGYSWLDASIGTDTSGSIRWPASWNGLYALRATKDVVPLDGVYPACYEMDTFGLLSRSIDGLRQLTTHSVGTAGAQPVTKGYPKKLLYPTDFFPHDNALQQTVVEDYIRVVEDFLGVKKTEFSIADRWQQCPPSEAGEKSIQEYIAKSAYYPFYYDGYFAYEDFRKDYKNKTGKEVFLGPYMRWKWDQGKVVTKEQRAQAVRELTVYRRWFSENVLGSDEETASSAVLLLPHGSGEPKYRDLPNSAPSAASPFSFNYICTMLGLPQVIIPIGQIPYQSRISGRTEHLTVVGTLVGAKGSDIMLIDLAKAAFEKAGWPTSVLTGRDPFELGDGARSIAPGSGVKSETKASL